MTFRSEHKQYANIARYETLDDWQPVKGYDFDQPFDLQKFLEAYGTTGIQATNLYRAIQIAREMDGFVFLSCTSNMGSSGVRDIIRYLVQHKKVHALVMSAGAVEEDVIKTIKPFVIGSFTAPGRMLLDKGVGRIGNIFAPYERYLHFEKFMRPFLEQLHDKDVMTPSQFLKELGAYVDHEESILSWAARNDIPIFSPALTDGSLGDLLTFQRQKNPGLVMDMLGDSHAIMKLVLEHEKTGAILLGGGVPKHFILNANIFKEGLDHAIYLTTATEHDASDSGGNPEEAISWAKIKPDGKAVKVVADASITFPLLVAGWLS